MVFNITVFKVKFKYVNRVVMGQSMQLCLFDMWY